MSRRLRVVIDTSVLVSRLLRPDSTPGHAVRRAGRDAVILISEPLIAELMRVLLRSKFDPYLSRDRRLAFIQAFRQIGEIVDVIDSIRACRDPEDDKILELAVSGRADIIVTGDQDLLELDPFRSIRILSPTTFLDAALDAAS